MRTTIFLTALFSLVAINTNAAPVDVTVNVGDTEFQTKIGEILAHPDAKAHKNAIRAEIMKQQALAKPLETSVVDPILMSLLKTKIKAQVMTQLRGTMIAGPNPQVNPLGELPGQIAPPPF